MNVVYGLIERDDCTDRHVVLEETNHVELVDIGAAQSHDVLLGQVECLVQLDEFAQLADCDKVIGEVCSYVGQSAICNALRARELEQRWT